MQNFAECIAGKGKFCGRNLRKKLQGQTSDFFLNRSKLRRESPWDFPSCYTVIMVKLLEFDYVCRREKKDGQGRYLDSD